MATSGTYAFDPSLGEILIWAYQNIGVRPTSILQEHIDTARMAANMILARWANQGVNLWTIELVEVPLVTDQATYSVDANTVLMLDTYVSIDDVDRLMSPMSRSEFASIANKANGGVPTSYWFNRQLSPTVTIWPVPDSSVVGTLKYYRMRQMQDANVNGSQQIDIPYVWLEAFADALIYRLARIWNPQMAVALKGQADESYQIAASNNVENSNIYVSPMIGGYFR